MAASCIMCCASWRPTDGAAMTHKRLWLALASLCVLPHCSGQPSSDSGQAAEGATRHNAIALKAVEASPPRSSAGAHASGAASNVSGNVSGNASGNVSGDVPDTPSGERPAADIPILTLTPEALASLRDRGAIRLIDVRSKAEWDRGMIAGAELIPLDRFDPARLDLSDGRKIVLYCRSGRRSAMAGRRLASFSGQPVRHLDGGVIAWQKAGYSLSRP